MRIIELATDWTRKNEVLSNPFRALLLAIIVSKKSASWNDVKNRLGEAWGEFNPNTLVFHLNRLIDAGLVEKVTMGDRYVYRPTKLGVKRTNDEYCKRFEFLDSI